MASRALVRVPFDAITGPAHVADGQRGVQLATGGFELERFQGALTKQR